MGEWFQECIHHRCISGNNPVAKEKFYLPGFPAKIHILFKVNMFGTCKTGNDCFGIITAPMKGLPDMKMMFSEKQDGLKYVNYLSGIESMRTGKNSVSLSLISSYKFPPEELVQIEISNTFLSSRSMILNISLSLPAVVKLGMVNKILISNWFAN